MKLPAVHPVPTQAGAACVCPSCLEKHAGDPPQSVPRPDPD
ncbi:hypothetical protein LV564_09620 [Komagataeibacter nataicola]|nr:hypothetical protein [Komagataeibacter nataicola]WEQ54463.1 hypothetical protein LV564_09620 [Komagataeibacter nataicola]WNM08842.1 hypothetical protein RI056_01575 [Komagataeibacter nataicola]